ncbi:cytochrome P450 family protein [Streptantibioticus silvisoli]|uniref:Cytochrome P450 n=1 Tax=Streptantibioticus silvisoli TaxID=2705255 RepID=A0ABT6WAJ4_9ACTN|nr:cytochrome P450 [Streptantibioticus silvisoli]MDI5967251.1 cytochrome P450 [Streptantibioticus silvisoli]
MMDLDHPLMVLDPTSADPYGEARRLREMGRCVPVELPQAVTAWITTDDATTREALSSRQFAKDPKHWRAFRDGEIQHDWPLMALAVGQTMLNKDGSDHARLRNPVSHAFNRRPTQSYAPRIEQITQELLDRLADEPAGAVVDIKSRYALPIPMGVICELLGIDDLAMREEFGKHTGILLLSTATPEQAGRAHAGVLTLLDELVAVKEKQPADDLTTRLLQTHLDGQLNRTELIDSLMLLVVAGHDTTVNLVTNAIKALLTHPEQLALVREGRYSWDQVIQETLRHDPPVQRVFFRFALADTPLGGVTVKAGDPVIIGLANASRDESLFTDAGSFDITREHPVTGLAFGHGAHYCLGVALARLEVATALPALFDRFPDLALATEDHPRLASQAMNGLCALPVRLRP